MPPKSTEGRWLCGVCTGLAKAANCGTLLVVILRLLFIFGGAPLSVFIPFFGFGLHIGGALIIYVVLACLMPPAGGDA